MDYEIRPVTSGELEDYAAMLELAAGRRASPDVVAEAYGTYVPERTLAAFDRGKLVGGLGSDPLELTVPGGAAAAAARITLTGVLPTHRRLGISSELNRRQLRWLRERGEPLAVFMTTGPGFYRRVGYSPSTVAVEAEFATASDLLDVSVQSDLVRIIGDTERDVRLPEIYERHRRSQPGQMNRPPAFWVQWFRDLERYRKGEPGDRMTAVFADGAGVDQGYLTYRLRPGAPRDQPISVLVVEDLVCVTDEARRSLWAFCMGFEQANRIVAHNLPVDEPLPWMLRDPRRYRVSHVRDFLWLRLVDVEAALVVRRYARDGAVVFDVTDSTCAENAGRFLLEVEAGTASCSPTTRPSEVVLDVADLAATYLGGASFRSLVRAGRVGVSSRDVLDRADEMFASRPAPWTVSDW